MTRAYIWTNGRTTSSQQHLSLVDPSCSSGKEVSIDGKFVEHAQTSSLEQTEGVPATICELCSVRLEDWHAFREQCIGSDEYLRVTLRHAFYPDEGQQTSSPPPANSTGSSTTATMPPSVASHLNKTAPSILDSAASALETAPVRRVTSKTPPPTLSSASSSSRLSLAKRRQSTFEWPVSDGKGNPTGQKITVEVLGVCGEQRQPQQPSHIPTIAELLGGGSGGVGGQEQPYQDTNGVGSLSTSTDNLLLEQASWSKEYCARINNLIMVVNGAKPFKCKICRRMFNNRNNMRRHIKSLHADEVLEGESPPPEAYGFDRMGGRVSLEQPVAAAAAAGTDMARPPAKKKRKSTDPPIVGPYQCEVCPRSFKMPAHLAVHRKSHRQIEYDQSELMRAIEQQKQQQQHHQVRERSSSAVSSEVVERSRNTTSSSVEAGDIIQLSDDDEVEIADSKQIIAAAPYSATDELDDGFDEEEGSLKGGSSSLESELRPDPSALAIVEIGAEDNESEKAQVNDDDEDVVVVPEEEEDDVVVEKKAVVATTTPSPTPSSKSKSSQKKETSAPKRSSIPPGPLSSKLKYAAQPTASSSQPKPSSTSSSSTSSSVHRCHLCRHTFPREDLLREHQKSHQHDTPSAYRCGWCKKGFRYQQNYTLHLQKQTCRLMNADQTGATRGGGLPQPQQQQAGRLTYGVTKKTHCI
uniref:C2H2-type domain-containing protein n=1 Tax=Anopheles coluzzii TaxID=1518534 RepID=A0A8W7P038_ANOCL